MTQHRTSIKRQNLFYAYSNEPNHQWAIKCQEPTCRFVDYVKHWDLAIMLANYHGKYAR